jgi:predicted membrane protein
MSHKACTRSAPSQLVLGALVIGLGVLFLLDSLNIFSFRLALSFWPTALIVLGVIKLMDTRSSNGTLIGWGLIGAGGLMTLHRMGLFGFLSWRQFWPVLLIVIGLSVVIKAMRSRNEVQAGYSKDAVDNESVIEAITLLGSFERRITTATFRGGEITAIMGACVLDLRDSSIEGEATVSVFAAMGGITLKVPPDWTVVLRGSAIMGGFEEKTARPPNASKRLVVRGNAIMGAVEVRN